MTLDKIEPGEGWRLIDKAKDTPQRGDQFRDQQGRWQFRPNWPLPFDPKLTYRRRIPAKPEPVCIDGHTIELIDGFPRLSNLSRRKYLFSSRVAAIRKFAEWLQQVAEWREAQDSK
jgi:hypothetical protein